MSEPRSETIIVSTAQLAAAYSISTRRVQQLRDEGMPRVGHGKWDLMSVIPWMRERDAKLINPKDKSSEEAQRRYYLARAGLTEHKEAEAKGQAVSLAEHKAIIAEFTADLANAIESFAVREYTQPDERAAAQRVATHFRQHLADAIANSGVGRRKRNSRPTPDPTADEEREPVGGAVPDAATA